MNVQSSVALILSLTAEQVETLPDFTAQHLIGAVAIDGGKLAARAAIIRGLDYANKNEMFLSFLNSATGVELASLKNILVNYVQNSASKYGSPDTTIEKQKGIGYVQVVRSLESKERAILGAELSGLMTNFKGFEAFNGTCFAAINGLADTYNADINKKIVLVKLAIGLYQSVESNNTILESTGHLESVLNAVKTELDASKQGLDLKIAEVNGIIETAKTEFKLFDTAKKGYTMACKTISQTVCATVNFEAFYTPVLALKAVTTHDYELLTVVVSNVAKICISLKMLDKTFDSKVKVKKAIAVQIADILAKLETELAVKESDKVAKLQLEATKNRLASESAESLKKAVAESKAEAKDESELEKLADLESNCSVYGLHRHFERLEVLKSEDNAEYAAYKLAINRAITLVSGIDDAVKQDNASAVFASSPTSLIALQAAYADAINSLATVDKPKNLLNTDIQVNEAAQFLANELLTAIHKLLPALTKKHSDLNVTDELVMIALYQAIGVSVNDKYAKAA
jgi:hypothetical protein